MVTAIEPSMRAVLRMIDSAAILAEFEASPGGYIG
jgi:hypothetical protein